MVGGNQQLISKETAHVTMLDSYICQSKDTEICRKENAECLGQMVSFVLLFFKQVVREGLINKVICEQRCRESEFFTQEGMGPGIDYIQEGPTWQGV